MKGKKSTKWLAILVFGAWGIGRIAKDTHR